MASSSAPAGSAPAESKEPTPASLPDADLPPGLPPGADKLVSFGKHKNKSFLTTYNTEAGYVKWALEQWQPKGQLADFKTFCEAMNAAGKQPGAEAKAAPAGTPAGSGRRCTAGAPASGGGPKRFMFREFEMEGSEDGQTFTVRLTQAGKAGKDGSHFEQNFDKFVETVKKDLELGPHSQIERCGRGGKVEQSPAQHLSVGMVDADGGGTVTADSQAFRLPLSEYRRFADWVRQNVYVKAAANWNWGRAVNVRSAVIGWIPEWYMKIVVAAPKDAPSKGMITPVASDGEERSSSDSGTHIKDSADPFKTFPELKQYQTAAVKFAAANDGKVILADEMGLGKTVQALAIAKYYDEIGVCQTKKLIICPATLRSVWEDEIRKWHGQAGAHRRTRVLESAADIASFSATNGFAGAAVEFVIVSYSALSNASNCELLAKAVTSQTSAPVTLICDECHALKDPNSKQSKSTEKLGKLCARVLLLSGTLVRRNSGDVFVALRMLWSDLFSGVDFWTFKDRYCEFEEVNGYHGKVKKIVGNRNEAELRGVLNAKMMRRLKGEGRGVSVLWVVDGCSELMMKCVSEVANCYTPVFHHGEGEDETGGTKSFVRAFFG